MSSVQAELAATGVAQVIVVPKKRDVAAFKKRVASTTFKNSERSVASTILRAAALNSSEAMSSEQDVTLREFPNLGIFLGFIDQNGLNELQARQADVVDEIVLAPQLSLIKPTRIAAAVPTNPVTWGIQAMNVEPLWKQGLTGKGVLVGHLDTGVDGNHPALAGAIREFADFNLLGMPRTPTPAPHDTDTHGTHTAATIAGRPVNGISVGVAPGAELASAIVIEGGNVVARVLAGLDWVLEKKIRVLSMSLGFRGFLTDFIPIIRIFRENGVLPVIAVGNEGPGTSRSPGNYVESMSVGAVDQQMRIASFSCSQIFDRQLKSSVPYLVGPGVDIESAAAGGGFQTMDGTSMATPHVAGLAALLLEANPKATIDELETAIYGSCSQVVATPERAGSGMPDGVKALAALP